MTTRRAPDPPRALSVHTLRVDGEDLLVFSWPLDPSLRLPDAPDLTVAERAVGQLLLEGESDAAIAAARRTSIRTVQKQVASVYRKLGVSSRRELWALCREVSRTQSDVK